MRHGLPRASGAKCIVPLEGRMFSWAQFPHIFFVVVVVVVGFKTQERPSGLIFIGALLHLVQDTWAVRGSSFRQKYIYNSVGITFFHLI